MTSDLWETILADPTIEFDRAALRLVVADQRRWTRRLLYPVLRPLSRAVVAVIRTVRVLFPVRLRAHDTMDRLCVWFLGRFVSPEAGHLLVRHFIVETNLLNFIAANTGGQPVTLKPTSLRELGNRAVIQHDVNVYEALSRLRLEPRARLDFSAVAQVPEIDVSGRRWVRLDIQSALCLMNIPFALCLTADEYRRAVHSLRLDESLLAALAAITGDQTFHRWRPPGVSVRVDSRMDVPRKVYEHAVICEHAHERLRALAWGHGQPVGVGDGVTVGVGAGVG